MSTTKTNPDTPAGIAARVLAFIFDSLAVGTMAYFLSNYLKMNLLKTGDSAMKFTPYASVLDVFPIFIALMVAYNWVGEQSSWQGTVFKRLFNIKVIRLNSSKKLNTWQIIGRLLGKFIWFFLPILIVAFVGIALNMNEFTALILILALWVALFIIWGIDKRKRTFYDYVSKTEVVLR